MGNEEIVSEDKVKEEIVSEDTNKRKQLIMTLKVRVHMTLRTLLIKI